MAAMGHHTLHCRRAFPEQHTTCIRPYGETKENREREETSNVLSLHVHRNN